MYGIIITFSIFAAASFVEKVVISKGTEQRGNSSKVSEHVWGSLFWALVFGLIGARLYHVIDLWDYYYQDIKLIPAVWTGGMGIFGGLVFGFFGYLLYLKKHHLNIWKWLDHAAIGIPLAQAIGRWGNFFRQELYGLPTNLPWAIYIDPENRLFPVRAFETFHPLFLYESLAAFLLWAVIVFLYKRRSYQLFLVNYKYRPGVLFGIYLIGYGVLRFFLEPLRIISWEIGGFRVAQVFSIGFIILGIWIVHLRKGMKEDKVHTNSK